MQTRALIAAVFCLALVGCDKPAPAGASPVQVSVQQPERRAIEIERDFIGEVAAVEEAEIRSKVNGRVLSVEFEEGSLVQQGQPLFRIDSDSLLAALNEAKANVSKAQADQTKVLADQTRYKTLVEKGTISRQAYDDIINKAAQAKAALDAAQAQLNQAQTMMQESAMMATIKRAPACRLRPSPSIAQLLLRAPLLLRALAPTLQSTLHRGINHGALFY
ncbi:efflux RND transporter periplasmic adaptor subunit [Cellvibrio sp. QJXJ]|uniref:efflux RND transporter periplasmic adaptor subunit n=1 Tax=Cellvibrio sp. QJXJ TaxID=2964606 RepID=UPI0021C3AD76|nr:biotin/lipoyl-binding protein [Cellvibrio sp. QJXJ]UUA72865.1 biotin/lipoyl-binding protein [Cellvibrio sp. QJXJ]